MQKATSDPEGYIIERHPPTDGLPERALVLEPDHDKVSLVWYTRDVGDALWIPREDLGVEVSADAVPYLARVLLEVAQEGETNALISEPDRIAIERALRGGVDDTCSFRVSPTNETGIHSGRRRYRVECLRCSKLLHEATTGPAERIEEHLRGFKDAPHQIIALAREVPLSELRADPQPGELVIDPSVIGRDPDAIGWLVGHDDAPYNEDGTGEMREVWHVIPLSGPAPDSRWGDGSLRWENAEFYALPESIAALAANLRPIPPE